MYDSRGAGSPGEFVIPDAAGGGGTTNYDIGTYFDDGLRYSSRHPSSQYRNGSGPNQWYAAYISRTNLVNAITDINNSWHPNPPYSVDQSVYALDSVCSGTEMYHPFPGAGWIGSRSWEVFVLTEY